MSEASPAPGTDVLLRIENLSVHFRTEARLVRAVDGASYDVRRGETVAVVGESGCGKSMTSLNPVYTIGDQIGEGLRLHRGLDAEAARLESLRLLELVRIPAAKSRL